MNSSYIAHNLEDKLRTKDVISNEDLSFEALLLPGNILSGLTKNGFRKPSPIQIKAIPLGRCGFDLIIKSKSGTGKTLVFSTVALETVNTERKDLQVVILVPTREIAVQIEGVLQSIGDSFNGLKIHSFIGGLPLQDDIKKSKDCHIAVGAPGRVKHLIKDGHLKTESVRLFILDEADKLMEDSFQSDINEIFNILPKRKQIIASSATYPEKLDSFLTNYMLSPIHVTAEAKTPVLLGLKQFAAVISSKSNVVQLMRAKNEVLLQIFAKVPFTQCLVFSNYQTRAESVSNMLNQKGWKSTFISGAQSQIKRLEAVNDLREFRSRIMLSTDLTARGIDASNVDLVINYDIPHNAVTYLHRMGRAGRFGASGICINLTVEGDELAQLQTILGVIGSTELTISKLPDLSESTIDLLTVDAQSLEQIPGILPNKNSQEISHSDIKTEIVDLKQTIKLNKDKRINIKEKESMDVDSTLEYITNAASTSKGTVSSICEKFEETTATNLFEQLAAGLSDMKQEQIRGTDCQDLNTTELLRNLANGMTSLKTEPQPSGDRSDDSKKRKREHRPSSSSSRNEDITRNKSSHSLKSYTFCKNKAQLDTLKLLCNQTSIIDSDTVHSVDEYLDRFKLRGKSDLSRQAELYATDGVEEIFQNSCNLKAEHEDTDSVGSCQNISSSNQQCVKVEQDLNDLSMSDEEHKHNDQTVIENIFQIGYKSAVDADDKHWLNYLSPREVHNFQRLCLGESSSSDAEEDKSCLRITGKDESETTGNFQDDEDYAMEQAYENGCAADAGDDTADANISNLPAIQGAGANDGSHEHFVGCYEECNNMLWQQGLTFETVGEFDNWFYQWQQQLQSVRNYVQQNIYIQEMSKYQQSRFHN